VPNPLLEPCLQLFLLFAQACLDHDSPILCSLCWMKGITTPRFFST
jgi:hypothetical protein